jgi:O-antigen/teichoic acid export membrane protein
MVEYQRDLRWGPESMLQTVSQVTELGITIGLAWRLGSAWALVGGALAEAVVDTILTYVRHPYRPSLHLARGEVRALFRFGRWEFGSKVASWLLSGGLQIVVGKVLGLEALGLFRVARRLAVKPVSQVGDILAKIAQSAYAKLQGSPDRLRRAHLRVLGAVALASTPVAVGMIIYGGDVARHLLGPRWEGATSLVQIFALCGLMETLNDATASLFRATGRPELHTMRAALQLTILTVLVGPLAIWLDAVGVALAVAVATSVATAAALWRAARDLRIPGRELALVLGGPSLASLPLLMLRALVPGHLMATLPGLVGTLIASALLYGLTLLLLAQARWYPLATAVPTGFQHWLPSSARFDVARRT